MSTHQSVFALTEDKTTVEKCCETCRHYLGGGYNNCRLNLEAECAAGEFEAWESKDGGMECGAVQEMNTCSLHGQYPVKNYKFKIRERERPYKSIEWKGR